MGVLARMSDDDDDIVGTRIKSTAMHVPTKRSMALARQMARVGIPKPLIAQELGIGVGTLNRHYSRVLEGAEVGAINKVLNVLYRKALTGDEWAITRFLMAKSQRHTYLNEYKESRQDAGDDKPAITVQLDAVGAISTLLNNLKRGDPSPPLIEQKEAADE